jgi:hypothetical protein
MAAKHFIAGAIKHPGAMTRAAKREGVSNSEYEREHEHDSGHAGQMARFAMVLKGMHHAHKSRHAAR